MESWETMKGRIRQQLLMVRPFPFEVEHSESYVRGTVSALFAGIKLSSLDPIALPDSQFIKEGLMPERPIGNAHDTPEQAALHEGFTIVRVYADGGVIARHGMKGYSIRKPYASETTPAMTPLDEIGTSAIGNFEDSPAEAASRAGMRVVKRDPMSTQDSICDVVAVDDYGMLYLIEKTGNGPFAMYLGFSDDPAMAAWKE